MGEAGHSGDCSSLFQDSWSLSGSGSSNWTWPRWLTQGHTAGVSVLAVGWAPLHVTSPEAGMSTVASSLLCQVPGLRRLEHLGLARHPSPHGGLGVVRLLTRQGCVIPVCFTSLVKTLI